MARHVIVGQEGVTIKKDWRQESNRIAEGLSNVTINRKKQNISLLQKSTPSFVSRPRMWKKEIADFYMHANWGSLCGRLHEMPVTLHHADGGLSLVSFPVHICVSIHEFSWCLQYTEGPSDAKLN